jgi:hypothetical protein
MLFMYFHNKSSIQASLVIAYISWNILLYFFLNLDIMPICLNLYLVAYFCSQISDLYESIYDILLFFIL